MIPKNEEDNEELMRLLEAVRETVNLQGPWKFAEQEQTIKDLGFYYARYTDLEFRDHTCTRPGCQVRNMKGQVVYHWYKDCPAYVPKEEKLDPLKGLLIAAEKRFGRK